MHTVDELKEMGFTVSATYRGPMERLQAVNLATELRQARTDDGAKVFTCLTLVKQVGGYNVVDITGTPIEPEQAVFTFDGYAGLYRGVGCTNLYTGTILHRVYVPALLTTVHDSRLPQVKVEVDHA